MTTYLLTYDLSAPGRNYSDLYAHLKSYGTWARPVESVWLVVTERSAEQVRDAATTLMDENDKILVTRVTVDGAWLGLAPDVSEWLMANL